MPTTSIRIPRLFLPALTAVLVSSACTDAGILQPPPGADDVQVTAAKQGTTDGRILFTRDDLSGRQIWLMAADGTDHIQLTQHGINDHPAWAPDGKRILFANLGAPSPGIYIMNKDGSGVTQVTSPPMGGQDWFPAALGKRVAFRRELTDGTSRIHSVNVDGTGLTQLTAGPRDMMFSASPKGDRLAFVTLGDLGESDIHVLNLVTGGVTQLTSSPSLPKTGLAFSPSGKQIAFARRDIGEPEAIFVMDADGTSVTRVSRGSDADFLPRWSPDGKRLAFTSTRQGTFSLHTMAADGTDVISLSHPPQAFQFIWAWMAY